VILIKKILENLLFWVVLVLIITMVSLIIFINREKNNPSQSSQLVSTAANSSKDLTSKDDWDLGSLSNTTSYSGGYIQINEKSVSPLDLAQIYSQYPNSITTDWNSASKANLVDNNTATTWGSNTATPIDYYWQIDLQEEYSLSKIALYNFASDWYFKAQVSTDGSNFFDVTDWTQHPGDAGWDEYTAEFNDIRYLKIMCSRYTANDVAPPGIIFGEVAIYTPATATHTSAATQITHNDLYQWQTFTPTYTAPANTTVSFRLRTSTDSSNWTDWTAYQTPNSAEALDISSLVTSSTGDAGSETFYKYIQVETKLTSSDGVSTPTVDSYSIGYHTNVPPNKPTGATATVGD
jgi:hypothetical protein